MEKIIFFGNGPLADYALNILKQQNEIIFHARTKEDLETVKALKAEHKDAHGVLASFGVMIKKDVLDLFEPEGILNIHPSLLPKYRGASPIESAILSGDVDFSVSVMKLVKTMDAGPLYCQKTFYNLELNKDHIYRVLAEAGADFINQNLHNLPAPFDQNDAKATFTTKLDKSMSLLTPDQDDANTTFRKIVAFQGFPKAKYTFYGKECIILEADIADQVPDNSLSMKCKDGKFIIVKKLQPAGKNPMDAKSFLNGYAKN